MTEPLYPRPKVPSQKPNPLKYPWAVDFNLAYDGGGSEWTGYYRTRFGARVSSWWHYHVASWGGTAVLRRNT